jgi:hypothetical protein
MAELSRESTVVDDRIRSGVLCNRSAARRRQRENTCPGVRGRRR